MTDPILEVDKLEKTFRIGFFRKRVDAVRGVSFKVEPGEIFGLLGPNGAGKTTTIKTVLGLIFPTKGDVRLFGQGVQNRAIMKRVGYMPENPYIYQYLKAPEFLDLCGRLVGMKKEERLRRSTEMIEKVGLSHAADRPIGKFSKGMMQRVGIAQALLHDPELLILDEPMSGLDPIGRKEIRDVLMEQKAGGKTLVFTSHILSDVEMICDRVVILQQGKVTARGTMDDLLRSESRRVDIELANVSEELRSTLDEFAQSSTTHGESMHFVVGEENVDALLAQAQKGGATTRSVTPQKETLENLFLRDAVTKRSENSEPSTAAAGDSASP